MWIAEEVFIKLDNAVNDFVKEFFEDYHASIGLDFVCHLSECLIEYAIFTSKENNDSFYNNFIERFPKAKNFSVFTLSILHEIGHLETEDIMINDVDLRNKTLTNEQYFNLFNEKIATDWAGDWINDNFKEAKKINNTFTILLDNIYAFIEKCKKPLDIRN